MDIQLTPVESTCLRAAGYSPEHGIMRVQFHDNSLWDYNVSAALWEGFEQAESKGSYFQRVIKATTKATPVAAEMVLGGVVLRRKGPIHGALLRAKKMLGSEGRNVLYCVWVACGKEETRPDSRYSTALKVMQEAAGEKGIGRDCLDAAIALAKEKGI
jgi:hypothetical protein